MRTVAVLLLLGAASCAPPRHNELSLWDSVELIERAPDPEAEFSLRRHLEKPATYVHVGGFVEFVDMTGWSMIIRNDWEPEIGAPKTKPRVPDRADRGLYANPIR